MKIKNIELKHFRSAADIKLTFEPQLNLFIGVNGAGKSTVLDALSTGLSWLVKRIERDNGRGTAISVSSVQVGQDNAALGINVVDKDTPYHWLLTKTIKGAPTNLASDFSGASQLAQVLRQNFKTSKDWPVIACYSVNRVVATVRPTVPNANTNNPLAIYENALSGKTNFQSFFEWFRVQDDIANEQDKLGLQRKLDDIQAQLLSTQSGDGDSSENERDSIGAILAQTTTQHNQTSHRELTVVTQAIEQFVPQFSNLRVKRTPHPQMLIDKNGATFNLEQLSEGEKNLISLIGDIARRLAIGNSHREQPLEGEGIIVIDEIDLHLHPSWQRLVIPKLLDVFPNCQFFISTHSPQVVSHVKPQSVFLLSQTATGLNVQKADETYGMSLDRVAELIMDDESRPTLVQHDLNKLFELIERRKLPEAKVLIDSLKADMKTDPDIMRAEMLVRREEMRQ